MKQNRYYITYERDGKKGYIASAPAIRGCVVHGKTLKEAHKNIQNAVKECLEVLNDFGKSTPRETMTPEAVKKHSFVRVSLNA